jgi:hypothetical protein
MRTSSIVLVRIEEVRMADPTKMDSELAGTEDHRGVCITDFC